MAPKPANVAKATDLQLTMAAVWILLRRGGMAGTIVNPPADMQPYFVDSIQDTVLAELDRRVLALITAINLLP